MISLYTLKRMNTVERKEGEPYCEQLWTNILETHNKWTKQGVREFLRKGRFRPFLILARCSRCSAEIDEVKSCKQNGSILFDEQIYTQSTHFTRLSCTTHIAQSHRNTKQENRHFTIPLPIHLLLDVFVSQRG